MTFSQLEIFFKISELKSFTATAEQLGVSQSAISHAIKTLEKEWQVSLFYREQHQIHLTDIGQKLLQHTKQILNISDALQQDITEHHDLNQGILRIGSFGPSSSTVLIPEILTEFKQHHPDIDIHIKEGSEHEIAQWILAREIDVGFVILPETRFDTYPLLDDIFIALIPDGFKLANNAAVEIKQLAEYPFLMTAAGSQNHVKEMFKLHDVYPEIKYNFSQLLSLINMVNNQVGVSIVADLALNKELLSLYPHVVKRPLSPNLKRSIGLAVKNKNLLTPATQAFINLALDLFNKS